MTSPRDILARYIEPGEVLLNRYQIEQLVGGGAYGAIFSAIDVVTHERVAVKALPPAQESTSRTALGRFQREMKIIKSLVHPNIVTIYDYGESRTGAPFMVLEFVGGTTLEREVHGRPMALEHGVEVLQQLLSALGKAHELGVIHRDLKPANIMIERLPRGYQIKVLDFGMAKVLSAIDGESMVQLTREGVAVGTPRYIAPEQARGLEVGPWTDLYAVGLLMYEIFTGDRVVKADTIEGAVLAHVSPEPLPLPELHRIPAQLHPLLHGLLAKDVKRRYQRASDALAELARAQGKRVPGQPQGIVSAPGQPVELDATMLLSSTSAELGPALVRPEPPRGAAAPNANLAPSIQEMAAIAPRPNIAKPPSHDLAAALRWLGYGALGLLCCWTFIVWGAQFFTRLSVSGRLIVTSLPLLACVPIALYGASHGRGLSAPKLLAVCQVALLLIAHASGPRALMVNLFANPAWALKPLSHLPGAPLLIALVEAIARLHAGIIASFL